MFISRRRCSNQCFAIRIDANGAYEIKVSLAGTARVSLHDFAGGHLFDAYFVMHGGQRKLELSIVKTSEAAASVLPPTLKRISLLFCLHFEKLLE